ncbi:PREDICTED: uncharacterized protein LOC108568965 isoform X2 [Nicrophorus vespilloides]|uniref:Uncharacterized protein LOC108568965 isoform X2 n=1 Tax=Nicrophorus vespilloides TaxID=110193 RepID=A0ABM1NG58_NICVS|nr:PREDICTED: uncharacterized protein LOC108568965 isoform X2 [Nicrophorus vespilloides]
MVFIHGESFEWNSGNPYDGSVLASYGKVIVVTLNFRLGILGFLKVGLEETSKSNFGLIDQVAALLWVHDNIAAFGGNPNSITLFGHGTGAACISLLMLSPMVAREGYPLFNRAILMGGTSLSDWALAGTSRQVTYQVAESLNCPTDDKMAACLRKKRINEIMNVVATTREYMTKFGPIVDGLVIPNEPNKIMKHYNDFFRKFELMYGLTEVESLNLLNPVALTHGMLERERDQELRKYLYTKCEYKPELYLAHTLKAYIGDGFEKIQGFTGHEPDRASMARDTLLDMLSDARSAAPIALMAKYHSTVNPQSYFYVFGHTTASRDFITTHGEELPYVFGVPLDGPKFHFVDHYSNQERLFSEVVMSFWTNFAYTGNPNILKHDYLTGTPLDWRQYDIEWPEYDQSNEKYLYLAIPPQIRYHYRSNEINYWNDKFPSILTNHTSLVFSSKPTVKTTYFPAPPKQPSRNIPPWFPFGKGTSTDKIKKIDKPIDVAYGTIKLKADDSYVGSNIKKEFGTVISNEPPAKGGLTMNVLIAGCFFLLLNVVIFIIILCYKCTRMKTRENHQKRTYEENYDPNEGSSRKNPNSEDDLQNSCGLIRMIGGKSPKANDLYDASKMNEDNSSKYKLSRQLSASTIDPHTKVRDWIAHEIVQRCSPKCLRRPKQEVPLNNQHARTDSKTTESNSTLGKSPTRPVSPVEMERKNVTKQKAKAKKVSVAIDATPGARSASVLRQEPIEVTKYLEKEAALRRSATLDNFLEMKVAPELRRSFTNVDMDSTIVKIEHHHAKSKSEPMQDLIYSTPIKKMKTFDPNYDINVTSREEEDLIPLTPEESLMTIKRRNFPKVLPDYPDATLAHKRRSMPAPTHLFLPIPENACHSQPNSPTNKSIKFPPAPPPRSSSTLGRKPCNTSPINSRSPAIFAEEPPAPMEPEITCNNLYVGPLIPVRKMEPIYDTLKKTSDDRRIEKLPKTIITTDPNNPIKKCEPKVIIKPTITRNNEIRKGIPRVMAKDNIHEAKVTEKELQEGGEEEKPFKARTPSQIPKLIKNSNPSLNKESSSESSSPSDESETGTVIKKV